MPEVRVYSNNIPNKYKSVPYEFGDETLESILEQVEPRIITDPWLFRVAIGYDLFNDLNISINTCLVYGDSISIYQCDQTVEVGSSKILIYIKSQTHETLKIYVNPSEPIQKIQFYVREKYKINSYENIYLSYGEEIALNTSKTLNDYSITNGSILFYDDPWLIPNPDVQNFGQELNKPLKIKWKSNAPKWRVAFAGLCLEGKCRNKFCEAYEKMVVMNMGVPIIYHLYMPNQKPTNCPLCHEYVKPETCAFNNCKWRYVGIREYGNDKFKRVPSGDERNIWNEVDNEYYRFEGFNNESWLNLVLETRKNDHCLTSSYICGICFSDTLREIKTLDSCKHQFHIDCMDQWFKSSNVCPTCRSICDSF